MRNDDSVGCIVFIVAAIALACFLSFLIKHDIKNNKIYEECQTNGITSNDDMLLCFNKYSTDANSYLSNFELKDFTFNESPYYSGYNIYPYTFNACTFTNMVIELNPLENVQFMNCTFINTKINGTLIQNVMFSDCIFEGSEFNDCIFDKNVKYYNWTISTITLTNNTYTPEHIENGVNKFELFVENSKE